MAIIPISQDRQKVDQWEAAENLKIYKWDVISTVKMKSTSQHVE